MIPDLSGIVTDIIGVNFSTVETNPNAAGISLMAPMTPEQYAAMQRNVDNTYALFTGRVAEGRDLPVDSVRAIAEGRVWVGGRAIELGLVDELGSLEDAVAAITATAGVGESDVVAYPAYEEEMWMRILRESGSQMDLGDAAGLSGIDAETLEYLRLVQKLRTMNPIQARMEKIVIN